MTINGKRTIKRIAAAYVAEGFPDHLVWEFQPLDGETAFPELVALRLIVQVVDGGQKHRLTDAGQDWIMKNRPDRDMSAARRHW
jgi:hypothetical protein